MPFHRGGRRPLWLDEVYLLAAAFPFWLSSLPFLAIRNDVLDRARVET